MRNLVLLVVPWALLTAIVLAGEPTVGGQAAVKEPAWPAANMKQLPADYLGRLRPALQLNADRIESLTTSDPPVLWVRTGIGGLALGQHVDKINRYLESEAFDIKGTDKFGFSLFTSTYERAYALFNHRTGTMKGMLSPDAEKKFEKYMWECAKANSLLAEAQRGAWEFEGSENHHVSSKVGDFLAAQFLKDIPEYAGRKYDDGSTPQQQYEARLAYWNKWIDERAKRGLFIEDGGSSYQNYTLEALINLRDFAQDPVLHQKADMFLDLVWANIAEETLGTQRSGPKTRTKENSFDSREYDLLFASPGESLGRSLGKEGFAEPANKAALHSVETNYVLGTSDYYPPPAVASLAKDVSNRGQYSFIKRSPGAVAPGVEKEKGSKWQTIDRDNTMLRCGFAGRNYIMGSHGFDTTAKSGSYRVQRWQGVVFANAPLACISMDGKNGAAKSEYISNPFKTIQDRNVMVTMKWAPDGDTKHVDPNLWTYFSGQLDKVEEDGGWIFAKAGDAYAAVKVVKGGYKWNRPWAHSMELDEESKSFVVPDSDSPIITVVNDASDYGNDFESFKKALKAQPVTHRLGVLQFATITHEGPEKPGKIDGKTVNLKPELVNDSPFIRSRWDSGVAYIRKANETIMLDFSDPNHPVRKTDVPVTDAMPKGVGDAKPIVFR